MALRFAADAGKHVERLLLRDLVVMLELLLRPGDGASADLERLLTKRVVQNLQVLSALLHQKGVIRVTLEHGR